MTSDKQRAFHNAKTAYAYIDRNRTLCKNAIHLNVKHSPRHNGFKYLICYQLLREEKNFYTECVLINGKITDILVLDDCKVIEILYSETLEEFLTRRTDYFPEVFEVISVDAKQRWSENLIY